MAATSETFALARRIADTQHHLATRQQLLAAGISPRQILHWEGRGLIERVERGVYLLGTGTLDWETRLHAVCLAAGAVASHRSAAALHGLEGCRPGRPEITIPRGSSYRRPHVRVHESTDLHLVQPTSVRGTPVTPVARTLLDLGAVSPGLVEPAARDAIWQRATSWDELLATLVAHARRGRRGCGPLRAVLDEHYGDPTESRLEARFLALLRRSGLPLPQPQVATWDAGGFIMRIDFGYPDLLIAIELDSVVHHANPVAFEEDAIKRNRLRIAGWLLLEFTSRRIRLRPTAVCEEVAEAIRSRDPSATVLSSARCTSAPG